METKIKKHSEKKVSAKKRFVGNIKFGGLPLILFAILLFSSQATFAHCDSYDGPVIKDAVLALKTNDVNPVLKWITKDQENEITNLFHKTYKLRNGDKEVYEIVEKHFFETLVRLHRETEGAPYTGLKPAGSTKQIIQMTDETIKVSNVDGFLLKFNKHIEKAVREKYDKVLQLSKVKDNSTDLGREFVAAYVDYTHTIEALHDILEHGSGHAEH
ncbi:MAG TPA: DUF6448 family protein [Lutibacter sp.]